MAAKPGYKRFYFLFIGIALAMGLLFAPPFPESSAAAAQALEQNLKKKPAEATAQKLPDESEWKERLRTLEDRERLTYALVLEGQRKTMDWWLSFLAIFTAVLALGGALIPFLMARKDKEQLTELLRQAQETAQRLETHHDRAEAAAANIEATRENADAVLQHVRDAEELLKNRISQGGAPSEQGTPENDKKIRAAIEIVEKSGAPDTLSQLRARAVKAELDKDFSAMAAFWQAILAENPRDAQALFSLGLANQMQGDGVQETNPAEARRLWSTAGDFYHQALKIKRDFHEAAYNWGIALDDEAEALAPSDLPTARSLWQAAGERYRQVLEIKRDFHDAANNWGIALNAEAKALAPSDLPTARSLWQAAGERYRQALEIKQDFHEAAYNWGNALDAEAKALVPSDLSAAHELWQAAGERYRQALEIKQDKHEAAYNWGIALAAEAKALVPSDLSAARELWQAAGEHYRQVLEI
ncbi:MAG: hypothetical protein ABFC42_07100, partial [Sulfuricella sp.]